MLITKITTPWLVLIFLYALWVFGSLYNLRFSSSACDNSQSEDIAARDLSKDIRLNYPQLTVTGNASIPRIYVVTPTYKRLVLRAELIRLGNTLRLVPNLHWIVVEDSAVPSAQVEQLLSTLGVPHTYLYEPTPSTFKLNESDPNWLKPRGVLQRNRALQWLCDHQIPDKELAVVYFADDDNTYDVRIFEEMRYTRKVSVWPVGLVGNLPYESPIVKDGRVVGWFTYWKPQRQFALDMAGFAVNLSLLRKFPDARFLLTSARGYLESGFLSQLVTMNDLEPKAANCTKILVWHTRTEKPSTKNIAKIDNIKKWAAGLGFNYDDLLGELIV